MLLEPGFPFLYQLPKAVRLSPVRQKETLASQGAGDVGEAVSLTMLPEWLAVLKQFYEAGSSSSAAPFCP